MSFNFDKLLKQGKGAADNVIRNKEEIREVLNDLTNSLGQFLGMEVKFIEHIEYAKRDNEQFLSIANPFSPKEKTGFKEVHIISKGVKYSTVVFKLKRSDDVYPITIARERNHSIANDQSEFASAIGEIVSSSQFHLKLNSFKREVERIIKDKPLDVPKSK